MSKGKKKKTPNKKEPQKKKRFPFWLQIFIILGIGIIASGVVLFIVLNMRGTSEKKEEIEDDSNKHTVTFAYQDGTVIEKKKVSDGKGVFPPKCKTDMIFRGWSGAINEITTDKEVHPQFMEATDDNLFYFNSVYVQEGKDFSVDVKLDGNVKLSSATLSISYDPEVMDFVQAKDESVCKVSKAKDGELTLLLQSDEPITTAIQLSQLTFKAKEKDVYATQIDLSCTDGKCIEKGVEKPATTATLNNKIYYLQEVE